MAITVEKEILWLEVAIHNIAIVQVFECKCDSGGVEPSSIVRKSVGLPKVREELATNRILEHKIKVKFVLKGFVSAHDCKLALGKIERNG